MGSCFSPEFPTPKSGLSCLLTSSIRSQTAFTYKVFPGYEQVIDPVQQQRVPVYQLAYK